MNKLDVEKKLQNVFRDVFDDEDINIFEEMTADDIEEWEGVRGTCRLRFFFFRFPFNVKQLKNTIQVHPQHHPCLEGESHTFRHHEVDS